MIQGDRYQQTHRRIALVEQDMEAQRAQEIERQIYQQRPDPTPGRYARDQFTQVRALQLVQYEIQQRYGNHNTEHAPGHLASIAGFPFGCELRELFSVMRRSRPSTILGTSVTNLDRVSCSKCQFRVGTRTKAASAARVSAASAVRTWCTRRSCPSPPACGR